MTVWTMVRRGMPRVTAMVTAVLIVAGPLAGPAGAEPEGGSSAPETRWAELLEGHPELMAARTEADALLLAASRRAADAAHDVRWVEDVLVASEQALAQAEAERDRTSARRDAAARVLARAQLELDRYRRLIDAHAATIYKHGPPALGPIESLLRSGSPGDFVLRHRISEAVLIRDDAGVRRAGGAHERADERHRRAATQADAAQAMWTSLRDDTDALRDLLTEIDDQRAAALRALAARHRAQTSARSAESQSEAAMTALEERVAAVDPPRALSLVERRDEVVAGAQEELEEAYPYLDDPPDPRPTSLPPLSGYHCPVEGGRFINDWAYPRPGGRSHEGTDVFGDHGATLVAVAAGEVTSIDSEDTHDPGTVSGDLGGRTVTVVTALGERWYYAHLDAVAEGIEPGVVVEAGQTLGTIGDSGNARGGAPHLHLGRYWQDLAVNPYPSLALACR